MRLPDVLALTGIKSKSGLYRRIKDGEFPKGERVSHRMVVWPEPVVARWQARFLRADTEESHGQG